MSGDPGGSGRVTVRHALESMRFRTAQVHGLVAHVAGEDATSSLILGRDSKVEELMQDESISSLECVRTTAPGVALEVVTYLRKEYGPLVHDVDMRAVGPGACAAFQVQRIPELAADDPLTVEYLLEVPGEHDPRWAERPSVGLAALPVIRFVARQGFNVAFVHAPASPPAVLGVPCLPHGPCARVGVEVPRSRADEVRKLGAGLIGLFSENGLHLWIHDTETPDAEYDAWRRMYPSSRVSEPVPTGTDDTGRGERLAITCIGPAHQGVTAELARGFADAGSRVRAVTAVKLDELTVAHGVVDACSLPPRAGPSGVAPLHELLGVEDHDDGLAGFRAFWSKLDAPPPDPAGGPERRVLWMKWAIPASFQLSPQIVQAAWSAVQQAYERWTPTGPPCNPGLDYVISRVTVGGALRGRAKVVPDLEAVKQTWPEGGEGGRWLRRFCAEIEDRWRTDLEDKLDLRRADLVVGWSESWLAARPALRR